MITATAINPGRLDRRIRLLYALNQKTSTGAVRKEWVDAGNAWASWVPQGGREFASAKARHSEATGLFRIRHRGDIDTTWQLVNGDDLFGIVAVEEVGRREYLNLIVKASDQSPASALSVLTLEGGDGSSFLQLEDSTPLLLEPAA